ncbi:MAG: hypothetical protein HC820_00205 [Hydrococcus sp. RM1_1_31]|nr:hypothetical protein [Hydrococcus sp. RM1_1_31]
MPCPEDGCKTQALWDMYHPTCNSFGGCGFFAYIEEKPGVYRRVFRQQFWIGTKENDPFLKVSRQLRQGYPACFELTGYDGEMRQRGLPEIRNDQVFVTRYCFNGKDYVFENLHVTQSQQSK